MRKCLIGFHDTDNKLLYLTKPLHFAKVPLMDWNTAQNKGLVQAVLALRTPDEARRFLRDLMTETEIEEFGKRFGRKPTITGEESPTAWLVDTRAAQELFGPPRVPLSAMLDWQADWIARGMPDLGKPTHFETRDGKY